MERLAPKLYSWASILEENTREQAIRTSSMPFVYPHLALMPDAHTRRHVQSSYRRNDGVAL